MRQKFSYPTSWDCYPHPSFASLVAKVFAHHIPCQRDRRNRNYNNSTTTYSIDLESRYISIAILQNIIRVSNCAAPLASPCLRRHSSNLAFKYPTNSYIFPDCQFFLYRECWHYLLDIHQFLPNIHNRAANLPVVCLSISRARPGKIKHVTSSWDMRVKRRLWFPAIVAEDSPAYGLYTLYWDTYKCSLRSIIVTD